MDQTQDWSSYGPSLAPDGLHEYFLPPAPGTQAFADCQPLPWTYPAPLDGLVAHPHQQPSIHVGGLPSPAPTGVGASPPDLLKQSFSPVNSPWLPVSPISPGVCENGLLDSSFGFDHPVDSPVYPGNGATSTAFHNGVSLDWTNTHFHIDHTFPYFPMGQSMPPLVPAALSPPWTELTPPTPPTPHTYRPDEAPVNGETRVEGAGFWEGAGAPIISAQSRNAPRKRKAARSPKAEESRGGRGVIRPSETTAEVKPIPPAHVSPKSSSSGPGLRTAARRFKRADPPPKPGDSLERQRAKANHNMVEQQYRHRLHARFEALLDVLPEGVLEGDEAEASQETPAPSPGGARGKSQKPGQQRRMSKVDVLSKANSLIRFLESENGRARQEVELLKRQHDPALRGPGEEPSGLCNTVPAHG